MIPRGAQPFEPLAPPPFFGGVRPVGASSTSILTQSHTRCSQSPHSFNQIRGGSNFGQHWSVFGLFWGAGSVCGSARCGLSTRFGLSLINFGTSTTAFAVMSTYLGVRSAMCGVISARCWVSLTRFGAVPTMLLAVVRPDSGDFDHFGVDFAPTYGASDPNQRVFDAGQERWSCVSSAWTFAMLLVFACAHLRAVRRRLP